MKYEDILKKTIALLSTLTDAQEITAESELIEDLGIGSMDVMFLISSMEEEFNISVPEKTIRKMVTVGDTVEEIFQLMK